uniref:Uncharacterized protein n=1 Tax=Cucumis melo TaxID=3656 RepID=A0A9I9DUS6_CUCME
MSHQKKINFIIGSIEQISLKPLVSVLPAISANKSRRMVESCEKDREALTLSRRWRERDERRKLGATIGGTVDSSVKGRGKMAKVPRRRRRRRGWKGV